MTDPAPVPKTAYILLWFPKPSETFIFREVANLWDLGMDIQVFTLYGEQRRDLSPEMRAASGRVRRLGYPYAKHIPLEILYWLKRDRSALHNLLKEMFLRPWRGLEKTGENAWAFFAALRLARYFEAEGIEHIHAPWANGPATAAWICSRLTGIPFSFTGRAWDIFPPDAVLKEKIRDAVFVRSETANGVRHMAALSGHPDNKFRLTYNGVPLKAKGESPLEMRPPYKLLALGRFVGKKGYDYLLQALKMLKEDGVRFHLTLAGDGPRAGELKRLTQRLDLTGEVSFPGFVTHDRVSELFQGSDLFLMPSVIHSSGDRDGIPLVLMESLLHRVPVIATDVAGIPELVEDGVTGLLIPEKNPAAIARAVLTMINDRSAALKMAEQGRAKILKQFDPAANYRKVYDLYRDVPRPGPAGQGRPAGG